MHIGKGVSGTRIIKAADKGVLIACIGAIVAVYILDAIFFAAWAPSQGLMPVFILIGLVIRTIAVSAGVALQWVRDSKEIELARRTIRFIWIACLIACLVPAMSFFAGGHKAQTQGADVTVETGIAATASKTARIERKEAEIGEIDTELAAAVASIQRQMQAIEDDGVPGIPEKDLRELERLSGQETEARQQARADRGALRDEIEAIQLEKEEIAVDKAEAETEVSVFFAIFQVIEDVTGLDGEGVAIFTLFFFALLIEIIAAFGLGAYYDLHRVFFRLIQEIETEEATHEATIKEILEPEGNAAPDPEAPMTRKEITEKSVAAKTHYKDARTETKLEIPPVLTVDKVEIAA